MVGGFLAGGAASLAPSLALGQDAGRTTNDVIVPGADTIGTMEWRIDPYGRIITMAYDIPNLRDLDRFLPATCTTRPDIARSHLAAIFADHDLRLSAGRVDFSHRQAKLCDASLGMLRYGTEVERASLALGCDP